MTASTASPASEKSALPRTCAGCGKLLGPEAADEPASAGFSATEAGGGDALQTRCPACQEQRVLYAVCGVALLFFCFVVLPLMIQLLVTPRPDR